MRKDADGHRRMAVIENRQSGVSTNYQHQSSGASWACNVRAVKSAYCVGDHVPWKFRLRYCFKNPFYENMSNNGHLWPQSIAKENEKVQHPTEMPTWCTTVTMSQDKQKTFIERIYFSFLSVSWATHCARLSRWAGSHTYFIAFYIPLKLSNVGFCGANASLEKLTNSVSAQVLRKDKIRKIFMHIMWQNPKL